MVPAECLGAGWVGGGEAPSSGGPVGEASDPNSRPELPGGKTWISASLEEVQPGRRVLQGGGSGERNAGVRPRGLRGEWGLGKVLG